MALVTRSFSDIITFTRASSATMFDSSGTLIFAPMNAIRNNTMVGAVTGTPGTLPTNWAVATSQSLTTDVVAVGTSGGINYIDLRISGTPAGSPYVFSFEAINVIAAAAGQTWTESAWFALVGGSLTNVSAIQLRMRTYTSGVTFIAQSDSAALSVTSTLTRFSHNYASLPATTAFIEPALRIGLTAGQAVDFTLRIGMPQLQLGPTATAVNATSGTAYQAPRLDYDPATLAPRGLLIEEQRTNRIANTVVSGSISIGTGSAIGPNGEPMNTAIIGSGAMSFPQLGVGSGNAQSFTLTAGQSVDVAFSGWFAAGTAGMIIEPRVVFDFRTAPSANFTYAELQINTSTWTVRNKSLGVDITEVSAPSITLFSTGVYRVTWVVRYTQGATIRDTSGVYIQLRNAAGSGTFTGDGVGNFQYFGLQGETGSFPTSYIPTTTAAATRSADVASVNTLSPWFNSTQGTIYAELMRPSLIASTGFANAWSISDNTNNERFLVYNTGGGQTMDATIADGGASQGTLIAGGSITANTTIKTAFAYAVNDFAFVRDAGTVQTDTSGTLPTVDRLYIGANSVGTGQWTGWIRRLTAYPSRLSNAQLQALTA